MTRTHCNIECTDLPLISLQMLAVRDHIRRGITCRQVYSGSHQENAAFDHEFSALIDALPRQIEIIGLELLKQANDSEIDENDEDYSYSSYAADSLISASSRLEYQTPFKQQDAYEMSSKSLLLENIQMESPPKASATPSRFARRPSVGSFADTSLDLKAILQEPNPLFVRRLSIFSDHPSKESDHDEDSIDQGFERPLPYLIQSNHVQANRNKTHCMYPDPFSNDSFNVSEYAHDSMELKKKGAGVILLESSLSSHLSKLMSNALLADSSPSSHMTLKCNMSNLSVCSFSQDLYDSQMINTGGVGRAA